MIEEPMFEDTEVDMYELLGVTPPAQANPRTVSHDDVLAAFMDDEEEEELVEVQPHVDTEQLLATLARDLLDEERAGLDNAHLRMESVTVHKDKEAYHLSLIMEMGGTQLRPFATVLSTSDGLVPLAAPKGLHKRWKPVYDALQRTLTEAMNQLQRSSFA